MAVKEATRPTNSAQEDRLSTQETADFKMVTFSLGGKDYGIDIMRVKEIAKFTQFTYVPNTAPYVRGVYNLRGDIISVIDLRLMFNLPVEHETKTKAENGLILRLESNLLGVIVDSIDKVVGIASTQVQPPHPIFGDINIKFISGVAEHEGRLYIILDVDRIFSRDAEAPPSEDKLPVRSSVPVPASTHPEAKKPLETDTVVTLSDDNGRFIAESLATFLDFHLSAVNRKWFETRLAQWFEDKKRDGDDPQLVDAEQARAFLAPFFSRCTGTFWEDDYVEAFLAGIPDFDSTILNVWNPGCSTGHESYSIALALQQRFPRQKIKIWAGDTDLMKISNAPNLVFRQEDVPEPWRPFLETNKNGFVFSQSVKDMVLFEFSDLVNGTSLPKMDIIVSRDVASFRTSADQARMFEVIKEILKPSGLLVLGDHEQPIDPPSWRTLGEKISMFQYN